jgi:hypothetical protein
MSPAHVGEVSNKGYEVSLRWDDKITDNLSYWFGGNFSNNKTKFKRCYSAPINGGDLANGQFTKLLDNSIGKPLGSFTSMITLVLTQKMVNILQQVP